MGAISAVPVAVDALRRNPVLFVGAGVGAALGLVNSGFATGWPELAVGILLVLLARPFINGGLYGMADGAIEGRTRLATFLREGRRNYRPVLISTLLLLGVLLAISLVGGFLVLGLVLSGLFGYGAAGVAVFILLTSSFVLVPMFFAQFYAAAIVVDGTGPGDGLRQSSALVRSNLVSTLGYDGLVGAIILIGAAPFVWYTWNSAPADPTAGGSLFPGVAAPVLRPHQLPVAALYFALNVAMAGFLATYHVAYYLDRTAGGAS